MNLINEGGPLFMVSLIILLATTIFLVVKGFKNKTTKNIELIKAVTLFTLVFGFFGFILGIIGALDAITNTTNIAPSILASGLKRSILSPTLGTFVFLIGRLALIIILATKPEKK